MLHTRTHLSTCHGTNCVMPGFDFPTDDVPDANYGTVVAGAY